MRISPCCSRAIPWKGGRLFTEKGCPRCHAVYAVGGVTGPDLGRRKLDRPLLEIAGAMWNHSPGMEHFFQERRIARPTFRRSQMASLLAFLYYLGSQDPPGDAAVGDRLFRQERVPDLSLPWREGRERRAGARQVQRVCFSLYLTASLWNHGKAIAEEMRARGVPRSTFEGSDIPDILAYIRSEGRSGQRVYVPPGDPKRGEALYTVKRCVECHSVRGHGGTGGPTWGSS